jgi:hypothetical protein
MNAPGRLRALLLRYALPAVILIGATALAAPARADILVDTTGGTILTFAPNDDDGITAARPLGFSFTFFPGPTQTVNTTAVVATNGNLGFPTNTSFSNQPFPFADGIQRIAPLWDDLVVRPGEVVQDKLNAGNYSVEWKFVSDFSNPGAQHIFEATLFGAPQTIGAFQFLPNDIAFSYLQVQALNDNSATVGLNQGDGIHWSPVPGSNNGIVTDATSAALLPTGPGDFILFRPNNSGGYNSYVLNTAVNTQVTPEPGTMALFGLAALALGGTIRRRRKARKA